MFRKHVVEDNNCELCKRASETALHLLWECSVAQDVWVGSMRKLQKGTGGQLDFLHLVEELNYCTCIYLFLYPEDSLNWHCDYRYIANRKKYSGKPSLKSSELASKARRECRYSALYCPYLVFQVKVAKTAFPILLATLKTFTLIYHPNISIHPHKQLMSGFYSLVVYKYKIWILSSPVLWLTSTMFLFLDLVIFFE